MCRLWDHWTHDVKGKIVPVTTAFAVVDEMTNASEIMEPSGENKKDNVLNFRKKNNIINVIIVRKVTRVQKLRVSSL